MAEFKLKGVTSLALKVGEKQEVEVEGLDAKVLLVNAAGTIQAIGPKCTHYGAPLAKGVLTANGRITCPWHGACFNAKTGDVEDAPALDYLPTFQVAERDGAVYVTGDKVAIQSGRRKPTIRRLVTKTAADDEKVVIVGGGSGAIGALEALREKGFSGSITMISSEGYLPIDRPKLSKALLTDPAKLQLRDQAWYDAGAVTVVADEVTSIDFGAKTVATKQASSTPTPYTTLILATGGTARRLPLDGFKTLGNIFTLRNVHDVQKIVGVLDGGDRKKKNVVVIGSSFIGMEVANATAKNHAVAVVGMEAVPLERVLGSQVGKAAQTGLEKSGVSFYLSASVDRAEASATEPDKVGAVLLKDGTRLEADVVVLGVGVSPATEYLRDNSAVSLRPDGSVETDESFAVVGLKDVYAVGDIASFPYYGPAAEGKLVRIEHWNVAQKAGRIAAEHIVRRTAKAKKSGSFFTPVFWSALSAQLRYCGNTAASGWDDLVLQGSLDDGAWAAFYTKGETVVAVATMGKDPVMVQSAELINVGKMPSKSQLAAGLDVLTLGSP
ncbi:aif-like mitochondrial oxidoreductase [Grosmannia clavigera kw1407]|uniref:Aif-like mitochondrial oxidoreductase n=1 Tax=Grosmannia clavigera (strain kw1407 / UAMH 11150) TaxID=655863 RepID=F0XHR9_GROCL|nr:aif-like mitochondrial oxidoreductase [Grosmannia clavigera kw1407]EFX02981.1 aif-like mitochondrial oxidoreductase [Grosmannia clavigera kw1407]